jgi:hypothetical protein
VHYKRVPIRIAVYFSKLHFITHSITFGVSHSEMPSHLLINRFKFAAVATIDTEKVHHNSRVVIDYCWEVGVVEDQNPALSHFVTVLNREQ